jgi:hypothetical protein
VSYSKLILRDSAEIVWPLDDIDNTSTQSAAINFFTDNVNSYSASININNTNLMSNPIVFGGGTLLSFTSSAVGLSIPALNRFSELYDNKDSTLSIWFQTNSLPSQECPIFKKRGQDNIGLFIKNNYLIFRCGTSASYNQVAIDFVDVKDPHHIIVSRNRSGLSIILDGVSHTSTDGNSIRIEEDPSHSENNYIDFYGPPEGYWNIDTPAFYPNALTESLAKRHYVYGLGKNIPDKLFYSRGGNLYNFSTIYTERLSDINWDYPDEWKFSELINLSNDEFGVGPVKYTAPITYSFDNHIDTSSNKYKFSSSINNTQASYIDVDRLFTKIGSDNNPFLVKFTLDGQLPAKYLSQRLITVGRIAEQEVLKFDLYNNNGIYEVRVSAIEFSNPAIFTIGNISSSPSFYVGMKFDTFTSLYFSQSGSAIQTASFNYLSASYFGIDPLTAYFPLAPATLVRIGSSLNYDETSFNSNVYGVEQFLGSFNRFIVTDNDFSASSNYSYIENYRKSKYEFVYSTELERFKVKTYGHGSFNIHSVSFSEYINDNNQTLGANYVRLGYPNSESSSAVYFYTTLLSYSGSVVNPQHRLSQDNYLPFINNTNVADQYLKFDFEIYADDSLYYPPRIKYFKMQTFKSTNSTTILKDDAGPKFTLYPSSSSVYLPEIRYTPTIYMTEESGIKILNTKADFTENILPKPLDPTTINGLKLWLDARFINGLNKSNPLDDSRINSWTNLSNNLNNAIQNVSASAPVFRTQSLNMFRMNQLDGAERDETEFIIPQNSTITPSIEGAISGTRGIEITPNESSTDSYIDMSFNTASITVFPNQSYSVVGTIKLFKPQTGSAQHVNARKIVVYTTNGVTEVLSASSVSASNTAGIYSLSAVFTTGSSVTGARILFYNGSYDQSDKVYWDNLGLYPTSTSYVSSWIEPLTLNDHSTVKFDGTNIFMESSASSTAPNSLYVVARNFGDSIFLQSSTASILYSNSSSYSVSYGSAQNYSLSDNKFKLFSILNNGTSASVFINGDFVGTKNTGSLSIDKLFIGRQLRGDISAVVLYEGINSIKDRERIERWLNESFPMY